MGGGTSSLGGGRRRAGIIIISCTLANIAYGDIAFIHMSLASLVWEQNLQLWKLSYHMEEV